MLSLVGGATNFQNTSNLKICSNNYTTKNKYPLNCRSSSLLRVADNNGNISSNKRIEEECLKVGLKKERMPQHVAIILDGSRRWLKSQGKPLSYEPFFEANTLFADLCLKWGIVTATTFVYSLKNLERGQEANELIFGQLERYLEDNLKEFIRKEIKVSMIGERWALPKSLQNKIKQVEETTGEKDTKQLELMLAICYAGTKDIIEATRSISEKVKDGLIESKAINEALMDQELLTSGAPHPDLLIRTGGRVRVSDYLMWQMAQTELHFTNLCAPEFHEDEFIEALRSFQQSERTFGK